MRNIKVFGSGCPTCKKLLDHVNQAVEELKLPAEVEYITDYTKMMEMGIMHTPALAIDGEVMISGRLPGVEEIKELLK